MGVSDEIECLRNGVSDGEFSRVGLCGGVRGRGRDEMVDFFCSNGCTAGLQDSSSCSRPEFVGICRFVGPRPDLRKLSSADLALIDETILVRSPWVR